MNLILFFSDKYIIKIQVLIDRIETIFNNQNNVVFLDIQQDQTLPVKKAFISIQKLWLQKHANT